MLAVQSFQFILEASDFVDQVCFIRILKCRIVEANAFGLRLGQLLESTFDGWHWSS